MLSSGDRVERYLVEAVVGQGGMAVVYRVRHTTLDTLHALKVLHARAPGVRARLIAEGRLQAGLRHPNLLTVSDVLEVDGAPALLMDYVDGPTLGGLVAQVEPVVDEACRLFRGVVAGVAHAHAHSVVHRDLKPSNVLLQDDGAQLQPRVSDFGIAKHLVGPAVGPAATRTGMGLGTPQYMAPEQIRDAREVDQRADIFSLGVILYELTCHRLPYDGENALSVMNAIVAGRYTRPGAFGLELSQGICHAIAGCLQVDRRDRIPDCATLIEVLEGGRPYEAPRPRPGGGAPKETWAPGAAGMEAPVHIGPSSLQQAASAPATVTHAPPPHPIGSSDLPLEARARRPASMRLPLAGAATLVALVAVIWASRTVSEERALTAAVRTLERLRGAAYDRAAERPDQALALVLGAQALAAEQGLDFDMDPSPVAGWSRAGGEQRLLPTNSEVLGLVALGDGSRIAAGTATGEVYAWEAATGELLWQVDTGLARVQHLRASPDGSLLAVRRTNAPGVPHQDGPVPVLDTRTGQLRYTLNPPKRIVGLDFSPDGARIVASTNGSGLLVFDAESGALDPDHPAQGQLQAAGIARSPRFLADGDSVAVAGNSGQLWLVEPDGELRVFGEPEQASLTPWLVAEGSGTTLALAADTGVSFWDRASGGALSRWSEPASQAAERDLDGRRMATTAHSARVVLWDLVHGRRLARLEAHERRVDALGFSPDGAVLATGDFQGQVHLWRAEQGAHLGALRAHRDIIHAVAFARIDGRAVLATGSQDASVRLWPGALRDLHLQRSIALGTEVPSSAVAAGGRLVTVGEDGLIRLWELASGELTRTMEGQAAEVRGLALDPSGRLLVVSTLGHPLAAWDLGSGQRLGELVKEDRNPGFWGASFDGETVVGWGGDRLVRWQPQAGSRLDLLHPAESGLRSRQLVPLPGGALAVVQGDDGRVHLLDTATGEVTRTRELGSQVSDLAVSPDGSRLAVAAWDTAPRLLSLPDLEPVATLIGHAGKTTQVAFTAKGVVFSSSQDGTVRTWAGADGEPLGVYNHGARIRAARVSPDGRILATAGEDDLIELWDLQRGTRLARLEGHQAAIREIGFDAEGLLLWSLDAAGVLDTWTVPEPGTRLEELPPLAELNNLRICRDSLADASIRIVPVVPFPGAEPWAPDAACQP